MKTAIKTGPPVNNLRCSEKRDRGQRTEKWRESSRQYRKSSKEHRGNWETLPSHTQTMEGCQADTPED